MAIPCPHAGTHTSTIMLIIVAMPMGKVARNKLWCGCRSTAGNSLGYIVYLRAEINVKSRNKTILRTKKISETMSSQCAW